MIEAHVARCAVEAHVEAGVEVECAFEVGYGEGTVRNAANLWCDCFNIPFGHGSVNHVRYVYELDIHCRHLGNEA